MDTADIIIIITFIVLCIIVAAFLMTGAVLYYKDRKQKRHPILRNYPLLGRMRYFFEKIGPEFRQYLFDNDLEGKPFSRNDYESIVRSAKYKRDVMGFGSQRDFERPGYYVRNALFPKLTEEIHMDMDSSVSTQRYILLKDPLFTQREEISEMDESPRYLLEEQEAIIIGENTRQPFVLKGLIGVSAMSYGALGSRAITALSKGIGIAGGGWMNTGEGGLSDYHLAGGADIIMQIGPGLFGVRDKEGHFNWDALKEKSNIPEVKAFELKLAQGAKTRGGHLDGEKVTEEIARIRMVEPFQSIDSPNRFIAHDNLPSLFSFLDDVREHGGKPVGIKVVIGGHEEADMLGREIQRSGISPDFITIDGSEGGTGASYQELADSVGLPITSAIPLVDDALKNHGVRQHTKIIASGKMIAPDKAAIALALGADLLNIARGFMISVGCIQTLKCHANICPVGVATTDPDLEKALVVDEKKWRAANYLLTLRKGLFRIAAAAGIASPTYFNREHIIYRNADGTIRTLNDIYATVAEHDE